MTFARTGSRRGAIPFPVLVSLVAIAVILLSVALIARSLVAWQAQQPIRPLITTTGPTVERLETLQDLTVQKVHVSDVMEYRNGWTAAWLVKGDGLISIPLKEARIVDVNQEHQTARIVLPRPRVLSARVDHEKTLHYDHKQGVWNTVNIFTGESYPDVTARAMKEMQRLVEHAVSAPDHMDQARTNATIALKALYKSLGWDVTVDWQPDTKPAEPAPDPKAANASR
jgi:hypothetical protein